MNKHIIKRFVGQAQGVLLTAGLLAAFGGCERILEVELPGKIPAELLDDPNLAQTLVFSAISDFECAYNNYTFAASNHSDETLHSSGNLTFRNWGQRRITPDFTNYVTGSCEGWGYGLWVPLHTARVQAENAFENISAFPDDAVQNKTEKLATVALYAGYSYTVLGEGFCQMTLDGGAPMEPEAILQTAKDWFVTAVDLARQSGSEQVLHAAHVGLGRVHLDLGEWSQAAAAAQEVPSGFELFATRSAEVERRRNKGYWWYEVWGHATIAPAFRGLEFEGVPDPRVEVVNTGRKGFDAVTDLWLSTKYPDFESDIPLATWQEARLIEAEVAARSGDFETAIAKLNLLHEHVGLPPFGAVADEDVLEHVFDERRRELFLEGGHRLNDMLRLGIAFPSGTDHIGQQYGSTTCFPLPLVETS